MRGASRYDAIVATLVGFCALSVSGYTAYMRSVASGIIFQL